MSDLSFRQKYVLARRRGHTVREAARRAGYDSLPGPDARRLADLADEEAGANLAVRRQKLRQKLESLEFQRQELKLRLEAVEALRNEGVE